MASSSDVRFCNPCCFPCHLDAITVVTDDIQGFKNYLATKNIPQVGGENEGTSLMVGV